MSLNLEKLRLASVAQAAAMAARIEGQFHFTTIRECYELGMTIEQSDVDDGAMLWTNEDRSVIAIMTAFRLNVVTNDTERGLGLISAVTDLTEMITIYELA